MVIRDSIKNEIYATLNFDVFRFEDFIVDTVDNANNIIDSCILNILYDKYFFKINLRSEMCSVQYSPGSIFL